jgi:spermidine synthase
MHRSLRWLVAIVLVAAWSAFSAGLLWQIRPGWEPLGGAHQLWLANALLPGLSAVAPLVIAALLMARRSSWRPALDRALDAHADALDAIPSGRVGWWILLAAGAGLFAELMIIRVHGSFFQLFAYFKNASLLSCFLGLGIGFALGGVRRVATPWILPGLALQTIALFALRHFGIGAFLQNPISEQVALGLDPLEAASQGLTVYGFLVGFFALNALCFIPLGHLTSRLMLRCDELVAYGWNLVGSLAGIALFSLASFAWTPPPVWFLIPAAAILPLLRRQPLQFLVSAVSVAALALVFGLAPQRSSLDFYSPYQILTLHSNRNMDVLSVNNAYFQRILDLGPDSVKRNRQLAIWANYYAIPYRIQPEPKQVLVVGAGTGNDVAAALRHGAEHVDAVEIDPMIVELGRAIHPEGPYASPRVAAIIDDARSHLRSTENSYDLIVYGLLDSHTLLSGASNVRLDSYVYTVEGFREARERLEPGGLLSLTFSIVGDGIGRKLYLMLSEAFEGVPPRAIRSNYDGGVTFLIGEEWSESAGAGLDFPDDMQDVTERYADPAIRAEMSTDDWPFFYMPERTYPRSYVVVILLLLATSLLLVFHFVPGSGAGFSVPCFFLGAGFMLLETKAITELALVFGSTWVVVSAVIASILALAFLANAVVARSGALSPFVVYPLLLATLGFCWWVAGLEWVGMTAGASRTLMTLVLTLPLFFAGLAFSTELRACASVPAALSANLMGAMLGGFLEYNSMYFGFESLWILAAAMYGAAFAGRWITR